MKTKLSKITHIPENNSIALLFSDISALPVLMKPEETALWEKKPQKSETLIVQRLPNFLFLMSPDLTKAGSRVLRAWWDPTNQAIACHELRLTAIWVFPIYEVRDKKEPVPASDLPISALSNRSRIFYYSLLFVFRHKSNTILLSGMKPLLQTKKTL